MFSVPFRKGGPWHNFAVETDWDKKYFTVLTLIIRWKKKKKKKKEAILTDGGDGC